MDDDRAAPADTRMMTIVHQALRRDLARAEAALQASPGPEAPQRHAIAEHLVWMMAFLRAHHESEDRWLYPVVRERQPGAAEILDRMTADHHAIAGAVDAVDRAARAYGAAVRGDEGHGLVAALGELGAVLLPHLELEEERAMPVVSRALTDAEWMAIEHEHNVATKNRVELALEGHWLIDDATPEDRARVLALVPAPVRLVLLHGYGGRYRRRRDACWAPSAGPPRVQKHGRNEVVVAADPDAVWDVVLDLARVGEWSHECVACVFLEGATQAVPGARFRGRNRQGVFRWGRVCEVLSTTDHELVWRTVPSVLYPDSTVWRIRVRGDGNGSTVLEQSFDVVRAPKLLDALYARLVPAHRDRGAALTEDLRRLGELART